jgi:hypothetical protein
MIKLSVTGYAKSRGKSQPSVSEAIRQGRLQKCLTVKPSGRYEIDPELADQEWAANTDMLTGGAAHMSKRKAETVALPEPVVLENTSETLTYAEARAQHERFKSRLAELEVATIEGKLVNSDEVKRESFRTARQVRDSLLNLPDRLAAELAAETNQFKVHQRLVKEIRRALEELKLG